MNAELEAKLIDCLDALAKGQPIEQILARYPADAAQLRPLLTTAQTLPALRMQPSEAAKMQSRQKFLAQADLLRRTSARRSAGFVPRLLIGFAAATIVAIVLGTGAVTASGSALPGDPLYGVKRTVENMRLGTAASASARTELQEEFDQRRRDEANSLLAAGRESEVEFTGPIKDMQPTAWIVDGLVVQVDASTLIAGAPQINRLAEVKGITGPGGLRAISISIEPSGENELTPTPTSTLMPEATETPRPTETPQATRTTDTAVTPTPRAAETVAPASTPQPVPTKTPQPTATPQPQEVEFEGAVAAMNPDVWDIDGIAVAVTGDTEIRGTITVGRRVKVKALRQDSGELIATRIELVESGGKSNETQNENQNNNDDGGTNHNSNEDNGNSNEDNGNSNEGGGSNSNEDNTNGEHSDNSNNS